MTFAQILRDVHSENADLRYKAMQQLYGQVRKGKHISHRALPIFLDALENVQDAATAVIAATGIEFISGSVEARGFWLRLLNHPHADVAARAALSIGDPWFVPVLIELLARRPEHYIHVSIIYTLGRLRDPSAFEAIATHLNVPEARSHAIEAFANLGDLRAIPLLELLLQNTTEIPEGDDRGATIRICDIADEAIRRIRRWPAS